MMGMSKACLDANVKDATLSVIQVTDIHLHKILRQAAKSYKYCFHSMTAKEVRYSLFAGVILRLRYHEITG